MLSPHFPAGPPPWPPTMSMPTHSSSMPPETSALWSRLLTQTIAANQWTDEQERMFAQLMGYCLLQGYFSPARPIYARNGQFIKFAIPQPHPGDSRETYAAAKNELHWWEETLDRVERWGVEHPGDLLPGAVEAARSFRARCRRELRPSGPWQPPAPTPELSREGKRTCTRSRSSSSA